VGAGIKVHSTLRPPMAYCASPGWLWWWRNWCNDWKRNRSTRRKPAPVPLCPPQTPHASRTRTRAAAVGSQRKFYDYNRIRFPGEAIFFFYFIKFRPALGFTQPPIQLVPGAFFSGIKRPGCEADHSPPPSADVENGRTVLPASHTSSRPGA
jgi:hypothetical protein